MKKIIASLAFLSASAFSATVTIQPGTSITLSADTTTVVSCQNSGDRDRDRDRDQPRAACYCKYTYSYFQPIIVIDGVEKEMGGLGTREACLDVLNRTPSCR